MASAEGAPRPAVLLVEDEVLVRLTLSAMLESGGFRVIPVASAEEALQVLAGVPDIRAVVTDVELSSGGMNGFELAQRIRNERGIGVVALSGRVAPEQDELPSGVYFIAKPFHRATLVQLVRQAMGRRDVPDLSSARPAAHSWPRASAPEASASPSLTPRQHEVLELLVQGKSNRDIAKALGLSENTVKVHMAAIFRVLGVSSRTEAVLAGMHLFRSQ